MPKSLILKAFRTKLGLHAVQRRIMAARALNDVPGISLFSSEIGDVQSVINWVESQPNMRWTVVSITGLMSSHMTILWGVK